MDMLAWKNFFRGMEVLEIIRFLLRPKFAAFASPLALAVGLAMIYGDDFILGMVGLTVSGAWGIAAWLLSDELQRRKPLKPPEAKFKQIQKYKAKKRKYLFWRWSLPAGIVVILVLSALFVNNKREQKKLAAESEVLARNAGWLVPDNLPTPDNPCLDPDVPESKQPVFLLLEDNATFATRFPHTVVAVNGGAKPVIRLDKDTSGRIAVILNVFDKEGKIVAWLDAEGFHVNPNNISNPEQKRPDTHTLIVLNQYKEEALYVHYLNKHVIVLAATLWFPEIRKNVPLVIEKAGVFQPICRGDNDPADIRYD
jgi:hypothetical protein